jgi:hypothetical protein
MNFARNIQISIASYTNIGINNIQLQATSKNSILENRIEHSLYKYHNYTIQILK